MRSPRPASLGPEAAGRPTRFGGLNRVEPDRTVLERLREVCSEVSSNDSDRVDAGRDWWPLSTVWAVEGYAPSLPAVVARPASTSEVADVVRACNDAGVPVTAFAGASGVCGGSIPLFGGVSLDMSRLTGIVEVDQESLLVDVRAGTFGDQLEEELRGDHGLTLGHWPQSIALSTVGGWVACRGAGQYSTRYGKIEDMVVSLEIVLADGRIIRTGGSSPRAATGPDLTQLFVGSEGTLGVITEARLRAHPVPVGESRAAYGFASFAQGLEACRRILRRGATPAVLRLYDPTESARQFDADGVAVLIVIDEGDPGLIGAVMEVVADECAAATQLDHALAARWLEHRNSLPALESLVRAGIVADTVEIAGSWKSLPGIYEQAVEELMAVEGIIAASAHQSHAYSDGACLYFTFAGRTEAATVESAETLYRRAFDAVTEPTIRAGGAISHHHGIGLNRAGYMRTQLGESMSVLQSVKDALDRRGILNPGKLGLTSPFGEGPSTP